MGASSKLTLDSVLLILTVISFLPHYLQIISHGNASGISLYYILFNLVSATHQFTLGCLYVISIAGQSIYFVHGEPPTTLDWLNLGQFATVLLCFLILYVWPRRDLSTLSNAYSTNVALSFAYCTHQINHGTANVLLSSCTLSSCYYT